MRRTKLPARFDALLESPLASYAKNIGCATMKNTREGEVSRRPFWCWARRGTSSCKSQTRR